jgi:hypothetical protein
MGGTDRSTGVSRETRRGGGFGPREKQHPRGANSVAVTRGFRGPGMHMTRCPRRTDPRWFVSFLFLSFFLILSFRFDFPALTTVKGRDGFGSDTHGYECGCHYLPHFILNSNTNTNIIEYEYKMNISNLNSHSNSYSIYSIES